MPSPVIRDWLSRVLGPYPSSHDLTREVLDALDRFPTLQVRTEAYTYDSGQTHLLLQMHGTIPITYRGETYYIPLCVWFPWEYPRRAPMVYVMPTREMAVRRGGGVEPGGRVAGGEVAEWERKWEGHSLASLLTNLQQMFSAQPPVYARPPSQPVEHDSRPVAQPAPPSRPQPDQLPVYQPPPITAVRPHPPINTASHPPPSSAPSAAPPPVPPSPLRQHARQGSFPVPNGVPNGFSASPIRTYSLPAPLVPNSTNTHTSQPQPLAPRPLTGPYGQMGYIPAHMPPAGQPPTGPAFAPSPVIHQPPSIQQPRAAPRPPIRDLLSSDDTDHPLTASSQTQSPAPLAEPVAPPTRPLPPSTLHLHSLLSAQLAARLPMLLAHLSSQTTQLESVRADLESGEPAIRDEMARLEAVRGVCEGVVVKVDEVVRNGDKRCQELEARGEVGVDEVVCSISIVHNQLIDLVAEDNALEDTIYHLARALDAERIDLDRFLRQIRVLAREQYQKRALIEKITMELRGRG